MTATHSDADGRQRQAATPQRPSRPGSNAQVRRAHAPARGDATTQRDIRFAPLLAGFARKAHAKALIEARPLPLGELWERVTDIAEFQEGALVKGLTYAGGAAGYVASATAYGTAELLRLPLGHERLASLGDIAARVDDLAGEQENPAAQAAVYAGGGLVWLLTAVCYAVAYALQFPILIGFLTTVAIVAAITSGIPGALIRSLF